MNGNGLYDNFIITILGASACGVSVVGFSVREILAQITKDYEIMIKLKDFKTLYKVIVKLLN